MPAPRAAPAVPALALALVALLPPSPAHAIGLYQHDAGKLLASPTSVEIVHLDACGPTGCEGHVVESVRGRSLGERAWIDATCDPRLLEDLAAGRELLVISGVVGCPSTVGVDRDGTFVLRAVRPEEITFGSHVYVPPFVERDSVVRLGRGQAAPPIRVRGWLAFADEPTVEERFDASFDPRDGNGRIESALLDRGCCDAELEAGGFHGTVRDDLGIRIWRDGGLRTATVSGKPLGRVDDGRQGLRAQPSDPVLRTRHAFHRWLFGGPVASHRATGVVRVREGAKVAAGEYPISFDLDEKGATSVHSPLLAATTIGIDLWYADIHGVGVSQLPGDGSGYPMVFFELGALQTERGGFPFPEVLPTEDVTLPVHWMEQGGGSTLTLVGEAVLQYVPDGPPGASARP